MILPMNPSVSSVRLVASWRVGDRTQETAIEFVQDLKGRLAGRIQLTSEGLLYTWLHKFV